MSSSQQWGTYSTTGNSLTMAFTTGEKPPSTPNGLIVTRAVETRKGWRGQVIIDREIIHETKPHAESHDAQSEANKFVINRVKELFAPRPTRAERNEADDAC